MPAKVHAGDPGGRSETTWNRICKACSLSREWKREEVVDEQSNETEETEMICEGRGESKMKELVPEWAWRRDKGSWFQRHDEAYRKKTNSNFKREWWRWPSKSHNGLRASTTRTLNGDEVMEVWRLGNCENFVGKWEELVFDAFIDSEPVKRA